MVPFPGEHDLDVIENKKQGSFPSVRMHNPALPDELDWILNRMLACQPRDRYQSAAELIHDLERSGLVPERPSFAEPDKDPGDAAVVQTSTTSTVAPTRIDLGLSDQPTPPPITDQGVWYLRYRNHDGRICNGRATTGQIIRRVRDGRLPVGVEARRHSQDSFQPLTFFPEFHSLISGEKVTRGVEPVRPPGGSLPSWLLLVVVGSLLVGEAAGLATLGWLIRCSPAF